MVAPHFPYLRTGAGWRGSAAAFGSPPALESATVGDAPYSHLALVFVYVSAAIVWLYALDGPLWALAFAAFNVGIGVVGRSWWYLLLPVVLGPLAIRTESTGDAGPGWAAALFIVAPLGVCLIALGLGVRRLARVGPKLRLAAIRSLLPFGPSQ